MKIIHKESFLLTFIESVVILAKSFTKVGVLQSTDIYKVIYYAGVGPYAFLPPSHFNDFTTLLPATLF